MLEERPDSNSRMVGGQTLLMLAGSHGRSEVTRLLLERGADADLTGPEGITALALAEKWGHADVAALLRPGAIGPAPRKGGA